ncbi:hypothetical protein P171DRAFT_2960 [Karstenula rhodostoma CBS 690.94]|uniref:F-box domain-containing protein n=1 Tax=Karstenula rhodostoma CBS 690.94 TaxID=1392251 RepID=A0A9P4PTW5_9PLEO|nr:hypothetical protein P171DRAFT_2960 [Karstenula rhodostoma CBS 690.94]
MKRKRSPDLAVARACPKIAKHGVSRQPQDIDKTGSGPCPLLRIIQQYGLLISIVANLAPEDLFSLAATSKAIYKAIFSGEASTTNMFSKMPCAGRGVDIRRLNHIHSPTTRNPRCIRYDVCGDKMRARGARPPRIVDTLPCVKCKLTTCDECRIHCVFNSTIEPEEEPDELPTYSGFVLLSPTDMPILTPAHLNLSGEKPTVPYHDQGFLDLPWTATQPANPESIDEILDFDLGRGPLRLADDSTARHPSSVIQAFWEYTEERKLRMCDECREEQKVGEFHPQQHECACTLRERVLGQWMCVECFQKESLCTSDITKNQMAFRYPRPGVRSSRVIRCSCGKSLNGRGRHVCLWCTGLLAHEVGT